MVTVVFYSVICVWPAVALAEDEKSGALYRLQVEGAAVAPVKTTGAKWDLSGPASPEARAVVVAAKELFEAKAKQMLVAAVSSDPLVAVGLFLTKKLVASLQKPDTAYVLLLDGKMVVAGGTRHDVFVPSWTRLSAPRRIGLGSKVVVHFIEVDVADNDKMGTCKTTITTKHLKVGRLPLSCTGDVMGAVLRLHKYVAPKQPTALRIHSVLLQASNRNGEVHWDGGEGAPDLFAEVSSGLKTVGCPVLLKNSVATVCFPSQPIYLEPSGKVKVRVWDADALVNDWVGAVQFDVSVLPKVSLMSVRAIGDGQLRAGRLELLPE